jgi:tetratricopeptide (TPR) repeat protein
MWQQHFNQGKKALNARDLVAAEASFRDALECAKRDFGHTDKRIPQTFAYLGRTLLFRKNVKEALPALRQAARIAESLQFTEGPIALADYLWAYLDHEDPEAEQRRSAKLKALDKFMEPNVVERINRELKELFTVAPKPEPDPPKQEEKPVPDVTADLDLKPSPKKEAKPDPAPAPEKPVPEPAPQPPKPVEPKPIEKPAEDLEQQLQPKPKVTSFNTSIGTPDKKPLQTPDKEPIAPERYSQWAEKLHNATERSQRPLMAELIASYLDMHNLVEETVKLYPPPHKAVGDHFMSLADITNIIGLYDRAGTFYELAVSNYKKALGANHPKTGFAQLHLAEVYGLMDSFDKAHEHFREAFNTLQVYPDLDKKWFEEKVNFFNMLIMRERVEKELFQALEQINDLLRNEQYKEADALFLSLAEKMIAVLPADHYNFTYLYHGHSRVLWASGRTLEASILSKIAMYLNAKLKEREDYNREMDEMFPEFSIPTLNALYPS